MDEEQIVAFLDNDNSKQGSFFDGKPIFSPDKVQEIDFDYVVIMTVHYEDIKSQLMQLNVTQGKILTFEEYCLVDVFEIEKYFNVFSDSFGKDILCGRKNCQNGDELWRYYDFLKMLLEIINIKEPWRLDEFETKLRVSFQTQLMQIDKEKVWSKRMC